MSDARYQHRGLAVGCVIGAAVWLSACSSDRATSPPAGMQAARASSTSDPTVESVNPNNAQQDTTLDVTVSGSNYDRGSNVDLALNGVVSPKVRTNATTYVNPKKLIANITIAADADTGLYDVVVTTSDGRKGIGIEMFTVRARDTGPYKQYPAISIAFHDEQGDNVRSDGRGTYDDGACGVSAIFDLGDARLETDLHKIHPLEAAACGGRDPRTIMVSFTDRVEGSAPGPRDGETVGADWFKVNNVELVTEADGTVLRTARIIRTGCEFALAFSPGLDPQSDFVAVTKNADGTWTVETLPPTLDASGNVVERHDVAACIMDEDQPNPPPRSYYHVPFRITVRLK